MGHLSPQRAAPICVGMFEPGTVVNMSIGNTTGSMPIAPLILPVMPCQPPTATVVNEFDG